MTLATPCKQLAQKWVTGNTVGATSDDIKNWLPIQKIFFLDTILESQATLTADVLKHLDSLYGFINATNNEIKFRWQMLCLRNNFIEIFPHVVKFVTTQGRGKFVKPLYRELAKCGTIGLKLALDTFSNNKFFYHPIIRRLIEQEQAKLK